MGLSLSLKGQKGTNSLSNGGKWYFKTVFRKAKWMPKILDKQKSARSDMAPTMPTTLRRLRQEDHEFQAILV